MLKEKDEPDLSIHSFMYLFVGQVLIKHQLCSEVTLLDTRNTILNKAGESLPSWACSNSKIPLGFYWWELSAWKEILLEGH